MAEEVKDINILYSKVGKLDTRIAKIESTRPFLEDMIERSIVSNEKLATTMQEMQITMVKLNEKMDDQAQAMEDQANAVIAMREEFDKANKATNEKIENVKKETLQQIQEVDERVDEVEEKGKFDIWLFIKKYCPWVIVTLGLGMLYASQYVKF